MEHKIIEYCNETESIKRIFDLYKKEFLENYNLLSAKEKKPVKKALPYIYRMWYYSALMDDTPLSPANFINMQIKEKYGQDTVIVPIARPVYKRKALVDFEQEFVVFSVENHPVLKDLKMFLNTCLPDIGVDENGFILEDERDEFIDLLTFREIFYVTFLTNISYELGLLRKLPSIGVHRAAAVAENVRKFFQMSSEDQLKKIVEAVLVIASKHMCEAFPINRSTFSVSALRKLIRDAVDLNEYLNGIMDKYNLNIDMGELENIDMDKLDEMDEEDLPQGSVISLAIRMELSFALDAYIATPLGYYLQVLQPIYIYVYDASYYFYELYSAEVNQVPLIKLFFLMPNGFDLTVLGHKVLLDGIKPKNEFQTLEEKIDFQQAYKDICDYQNEETALDEERDNFSEEEILNAFFEQFAPKRRGKNNKDALNVEPEKNEEVITEKNTAYIFKVKKVNNKRKFITVAVKGTQSFEDLVDAIRNKYDLEWGHLYSFFMNNKPYDRDYEIPCPYDREASTNTEKVKLHQVKLYKSQRFLFIYDFGEDITFEIEFVGTEPLQKDMSYPAVIPNKKA
ncbi:plasmid pRiA4b ORF-3 family protein [Clostridium thermarum]|uniref:plasmid pRiA4b ORF-3 family protein n=1 Tax=Clostridium thermarum TaxID=1716543 RepID=UPI0013D51FE2|nr:plasmid pRiA4b ORF-3 family protein [Clostridium thermarum]